jgi:hypothetical protein
MRKYKTFDGEIVDLDYSTTYEHLPSDCNALDDLMFKEIGQAICYMDCFHPEVFNKQTFVMKDDGSKAPFDGGQRDRIELMIKDFCDNRRDHYNDEMWYKEKIFLFQDETENMC